MQKYIGIKMVEATAAQKDGVDGYNIVYDNGYASWSPKDVFESAYMPIQVSNSLVQPDIDAFIADVQISKADDKTVLLRAETVTGFSIFETASCVDPENYDEDKGANLAMVKAYSKVWFAMGFILQWARYGLKHTAKKENA